MSEPVLPAMFALDFLQSYMTDCGKTVAVASQLWLHQLMDLSTLRQASLAVPLELVHNVDLWDLCALCHALYTHIRSEQAYFALGLK